MPTVEELEAELAVVRAENTRLTGETKSAQTRIHELNQESMGHRQAAKTAKDELDGLKTSTAATLAEKEQARSAAEAAAKAAEDARLAAETAAQGVTTAAQERAINADLKIAAAGAGAIDTAEVLTLLDRSKIELDDKGEIKNAAALIEEMKKAKAHLFGATTKTTTSKSAAPPPAPNDAKPATKMTDEEWRAARAAIRQGKKI